MRQRLVQTLVCALLVLSIGGHWVMLQSIAWTSMLINFSAEMPLAEAVVKTFDGKHPCKMCLAIQEGKKTERKQTQHAPTTKLWLILETPACILAGEQPSTAIVAFVDGWFSRSQPPLLPPPRPA